SYQFENRTVSLHSFDLPHQFMNGAHWAGLKIIPLFEQKASFPVKPEFFPKFQTYTKKTRKFWENLAETLGDDVGEIKQDSGFKKWQGTTEKKLAKILKQSGFRGIEEITLHGQGDYDGGYYDNMIGLPKGDYLRISVHYPLPEGLEKRFDEEYSASNAVGEEGKCYGTLYAVPDPENHVLIIGRPMMMDKKVWKAYGSTDFLDETGALKPV
ncbi:MAG: hypothetical protein GOU97_01790, partial [Nanoarchaeota archaeon]|nr:hypothetical protein [Nanoarchaeota archaeon]